MYAGIDIGIDFLNFAIGRQQKTYAACLSVTQMNTKGIGPLSAGVSNNRKRERVLLCKACMRSLSIFRHAKQANVRFAVKVPNIPECTGFFGTARCVVFGVEVNYRKATSRFCQVMRITMLINA